MLNYSIDDLRAFCYAARAGQFLEAADQLFISASALSRRIANLESQVGGSLFVRSTRQLKLTPLGAAFYPQVSPLLAEMDRTFTQAIELARGEKGNLQIGIVATIAYNIAPDVLKRFRANHPNVSISMHDGLAASITHLVENDKVEFGISTQMAFGPEIEAELICDYGYVIAVSKNHPAFHDAVEVSWSQLVNFQLVGLGPTSSTRLQIDAEMQRLGIDLSWAVEIDQLSTILEMAKTDDQVAVLPSLIRGENDTVRFIRISTPTLKRGLFAIRKKNRQISSIAQDLLDMFVFSIKDRLG